MSAEKNEPKTVNETKEVRYNWAERHPFISCCGIFAAAGASLYFALQEPDFTCSSDDGVRSATVTKSDMGFGKNADVRLTWNLLSGAAENDSFSIGYSRTVLGTYRDRAEESAAEFCAGERFSLPQAGIYNVGIINAILEPQQE